MKVTQYQPAFFGGFEIKTYEFETLEQLYEIPFIKRFTDYDCLLCLSYDVEQTLIMAIKPNKETELGCEWWVVGIINEDAKELFSWGMLDWNSIIRGLKFLKKNTTKKIIEL